MQQVLGTGIVLVTSAFMMVRSAHLLHYQGPATHHPTSPALSYQPNPLSSGASSGSTSSGLTRTQLGVSEFESSLSTASGSVQGLGASSINSGFTSDHLQSPPLQVGTSRNTHTGATSVQNTAQHGLLYAKTIYPNVQHQIVLPSLQVPATSGSSLGTTGFNTYRRPHGLQYNRASDASLAGGSATGSSASSVNHATSGQNSQQGPYENSRRSHTDVQSIQTTL